MIKLYGSVDKGIKMNDLYFAEDNAVNFDLQNGKIETLAFARDKNMAKEIARALNLLDDKEE